MNCIGRGRDTSGECEEGHSLPGAGIGNIQGCVEEFNVGQTSNPRLAWKKFTFSK